MPAGPGLGEPLPHLLELALRTEVFALARSERRRRFPAVLRAGFPASARVSTVAAPRDADHPLRVEVVQALVRPYLAAGRVPLLWLTRPLDADATDNAWAAAVGSAGAELDVALDLVVLTRTGWHDPRSGVGRAWVRPRHDRQRRALPRPA